MKTESEFVSAPVITPYSRLCRRLRIVYGSVNLPKAELRQTGMMGYHLLNTMSGSYFFLISCSLG